MVRIEDITSKRLGNMEKLKKITSLAKQIFGESIIVEHMPLYRLNIGKEGLKGSFLVLDLDDMQKPVFYLNEEKYFTSTKELAKECEKKVINNILIRADYSKIYNFNPNT